MGKQKRTFLNLVICSLLIFMTAIPVLAQPIINENMDSNYEICSIVDIGNYSDEILLDKKTVLPDGAVLTPISKDEYVSRLAKEKNISIEEAYELEFNGISLAATSTISYIDYTKDFSYSGNSNFEATLLATLKIRKWQGGAAQIENVLSVSSQRKSGVYDYIWIETDSFSDPAENGSGYPVTSVVLTAKGYFEVTVDKSIEGSISIPGFSIAGSVGTIITYISKNMPMRSTFSLY